VLCVLCVCVSVSVVCVVCAVSVVVWVVWIVCVVCVSVCVCVVCACGLSIAHRASFFFPSGEAGGIITAGGLVRFRSQAGSGG
jgi:hypothetical protein